jgi:hypothetical protein
MELDDFKGAWKQKTQQTAKQLLRDEELLAMLHMKASNTIDLLKKSVRFELWFTVLFIMVCVAVVFKTADQTIRDISFITIIISCGFGYYYYKKLLLLNNLNIENKSIKENLTHLITQFEKFLWFYRWGFNILFPIALLGGAFAGIQVSTEKDFIQLFSQIKLWAVLIIIFVPITLLFNFGMKWYLKKLYGKHLSHLRFLLLELQD